MRFVADLSDIDTSFNSVLTVTQPPSILLSQQSMEIKSCDTAKLLIAYPICSCARGSYRWLHVGGLDSSEYHIVNKRHKPCTGESDTAVITLSPKNAGVYPLTFDLMSADNVDTIIECNLTVTRNPIALIAKHLYDFGAQSLCRPVLETDSFQISGPRCEFQTVDSIVFRAISGIGKHFSFQNVKGFIAGDSVRTFRTTYKPTQVGVDSAHILIYSFDGVTHRIDTLALRGAGVADTRSFSIASKTLHTRMCDSVVDSIAFRNTTCGYLQVDSVALVPGLTLPPGALRPSQLPLELWDTTPQFLLIRFAPQSLADTTIRVTAHLTFINHGQTISFDTILSISAIVGRGAPAETLSTHALDFGDVSLCGMSKTLPAVILSTGCDTLTCGGAIATPPFSIVKQFASAVAVGANDMAWIRFTPTVVGVFYDTLIVQTNAGLEQIALSGTGVTDIAALAIPATNITLPPVIAGCTAVMDTIWIFDSTCKSITIDSTRVEATAPRGALTLPIVVTPVFDNLMGRLDSIGIVASFYPTSADTGTGSVRMHIFFHGEDGVGHDTTLAISASAVAPAAVKVHVGEGAAGGALHAGSQGFVTIPLYIHTSSSSDAIASADLASLDVRVWFNTDLLTPLTLTVLGQSFDAYEKSGGRVPLMYQSDGAFLHLPLPTGFAMTGDSLIASLTCQVFVTDTMQTLIWIDPVSISGASSEESCLGVSADTSSIVFTLDPGCTDSLLTEFIGTHAFQIESIVPNPASNTVTINLAFSDSGVPQDMPYVSVGMYDVLGKEVLTRGSPQSATVRLDVSGLPEGAYYLRLSGAGEVLTRRVVIRR